MHHCYTNILAPHFLKWTSDKRTLFGYMCFPVKVKYFHLDNNKGQTKQTGLYIYTIYARPRINIFNKSRASKYQEL